MRAKLIFTVALACAISASTALAQQSAKITSSGIGFLEYLPQDYNNNNNDYPIVIFLHGIGERGTTSTDPATLLSSVQNVAKVGLAKYVKYGAQYPFIIISPQLKTSYGTWPANYVMDVLNYVKRYLRIDESRIYITGLSLGGFGTWTTLGAYPQVFAAAVPICSGGSALTKACAIAAENIPLWGFHGTEDKVVSYTVTTKMINAVNACTPQPSPLAKTTLFYGDDHIIWDRVYQQTDAIKWMLGFTNGGTAPEPSPTPVTNTAPVVSAGSDLAVTLPSNEVYIYGKASDADGSIVSYKWTKVSGGSVGMTNTGGSRLRAYNLLEGTYTFRLSACDDKGATRSDDVVVKVSGSSGTNASPVVSAGTDLTVTLPTNEVYVYGKASDTDGSIVSYKWTKVNGGPVGMTNTGGSRLRAYNLLAGSYTFRLTVTDDKGATSSDNVVVNVLNTSTTNISPAVSAGSDVAVALPTKEVYIQGKASDPDGNIVSYRWGKVYGGPVGMTNTGGSRLRVYNLLEGSYKFRLTVKDDDGASKSDEVMVTVSADAKARIHKPARRMEDVASYRLLSEDESTDDAKMTITDYRFIKDLKRSLRDNGSGEELFHNGDES